MARIPLVTRDPEMAQRLEALRCAFIWYAHAAAARPAGVRDDIVDDIRERRVSRPTFDAATARFGQRGVMTLTNLIACSAMLAYSMTTYELQAPAHPTEKALTT